MSIQSVNQDWKTWMWWFFFFRCCKNTSRIKGSRGVCVNHLYNVTQCMMSVWNGPSSLELQVGWLVYTVFPHKSRKTRGSRRLLSAEHRLQHQGSVGEFKLRQHGKLCRSERGCGVCVCLSACHSVGGEARDTFKHLSHDTTLLSGKTLLVPLLKDNRWVRVWIWGAI